MAGTKTINLAKFFRQDSAVPSGVGVRETMGINPQVEVTMSGGNLSSILKIIQTNTEITKEQQEYIRVEDRNDNLLQSSIIDLEKNILGLQSSLLKLRGQFESDLLARQRAAQKEKRATFAGRAEESKSMSTAQQNLVDYESSAYQMADEPSDNSSGSAGVAAALAGFTGAVLGALGMKDDEEDPNYTPPPGKTYTLPQLKELALSVGFKGENADKAAAVAYAESTGDTGAHFTPEESNNTDDSYGLWQINMIGDMGPERRKKFGLKSNKELLDPQVNARVAFAISGGSNFSAWSTYGEDKYKDALEKIKKLPDKTSQKTSAKPGATSPQASASAEPASSTVAAATPSADTDPMETSSVSAAPSAAGDKVSQALTPPAGAGTGGAPIVIPINNQQQPVAQTQVSAGDAIPGGLTANLNNFYPSIAKAVLGIM